MVAQLDRQAVRVAPGRAVSRLVGYSMFEGRPATTRGTWFNPVVRANLRIGARIGRGPSVDAPIFIVGIGRSGTTLLGQLLALHPDVGYLNEPKAMWAEIHPDDDIIGSYTDHVGRLLLSDADVDAAAVERANRIYSWYLRWSRSTRVVDKYPELAYRESYLRGIFPDALIVAILRHPWDVTHSISTWNVEHGDSASNWWGVNDRKWWVLWNEVVIGQERHAWLADLVDPEAASDELRGAVEWFVGTTAASEIGDTHHLDYDDLLSAPRNTLTAVMDACNLARSARVLDFAEGFVRPVRHHKAPPDDIPDELVQRCDDLYRRVRS